MSISTSREACGCKSLLRTLPLPQPSSPRLRASPPEDNVYFGEVSLTGAVKTVGHMDQRLKEAAKLGFARAVVPAAAAEGHRETKDLGLLPLSQLDELVALFGTLPIE